MFAFAKNGLASRVKQSAITLIALALAGEPMIQGGESTQLTSTKLFGRITDQKGQGIPEAYVEARNAKGDKIGAVSTYPDGSYEMTLRVARTEFNVTLKIRKPGFQNYFSEGVTIRLGANNQDIERSLSPLDPENRH